MKHWDLFVGQVFFSLAPQFSNFLFSDLLCILKNNWGPQINVYFMNFYWSKMDIQYPLSFRWISYWLDTLWNNVLWNNEIIIHYEIMLIISPVTTCQNYYNIDCISHAVHYIHMTYLSYNCMFVPPKLLYLFLPPPNPSPLWEPTVGFLYLGVCFCFVLIVHLFCFLDSICNWNNIVFVFLWLLSISNNVL